MRLLVALTVLLAGCQAPGPIAELPAGDAVELTGVPFFPQTEDLCGPAALATVLAAAGVSTDLEQARAAIFIPGRSGSLQLELIAALRGHELLAYPVTTLAGIAAELDRGRPVLVFQNLGMRLIPAWHYAVVIGYDGAAETLVLRSGEHRRLRVASERFLRTWRRADRWAVVALPPGMLPVAGDPATYLARVADFEALGHLDAAATNYRAATEAWPDYAVGWLGLGNVRYASGDLRRAERAYRRAVAVEPGFAVALNNLAQTLADQGRLAEARGFADRALAAAEGTPLADRVRATRDHIRHAQQH